MEIKINREILQYSESVFLGLSLRQFICSVLALGAAVGVYFLLQGTALMSAASTLSMAAALPFALLGFFKYHSLTAEQFLLVWFRSEILESRILLSRPRNIYMDILSF